jgi:hypothetical protein
MKRILLVSAIMLGMVGVNSCTTVASTTASIATYLSSPSPTQATTLAEAIQGATLVTNAVDAYVNLGIADRGTLLQLQALSNGVHQALLELMQANKDKKSISYASFNAALKAFNAYTTTIGVKK